MTGVRRGVTRWVVAAAAVPIALAIALAAGSGAARAQHPPGDSGSPTIPGTTLLRLGDQWSVATNHNFYRYLIVGRSAASAAARRAGMSLVYHSGTSVNTQWDAGVPYPVAAAHGWLLRDESGSLLKNSAYPDNYIGDVGSSSYQAEWARRVARFLSSARVDGVYIDDVAADIDMVSSAYPAKYPTQAAWEDAMASFVINVGSALKARGFYVLVNAGKWIGGDPGSDDGTLTADWWKRLAPGVSGFHNEFFVQSPVETAHLRGEGPEWDEQWSGTATLVTTAQALGRDFFGLTYGSPANVQAMRYARASFLLFWDGGGGGVAYQTETGDPWSSEWTVDVGVPAGRRTAVGVGWRRPYSKGIVLANPSTSSSQPFALGDSYLMPNGRRVRSVTLAPKSGLILRRSEASAALRTRLGAARRSPSPPAWAPASSWIRALGKATIGEPPQAR